MISQTEHAGRRNEIMNKLDIGVLLISSYPERLLSNDTNHKYRQQSDFLYFTGFPEPNSLVILEKTNDEIIYHLFVPKKDKDFETWYGRRYGVEGALKHFKADKAYTLQEIENTLPDLLKKYENIYFTEGRNYKNDKMIKRAIKKATGDKERTGRGPVNLINPIDVIHGMRIVKSENEIKLLRKAASISANAIKRAIATTKPGMMEYEIEALINYEFRKNGCDRAASATICGAGVNATILHYIENNSQLNNGDLLLVDAGGEYQNYVADITRTWPINGKFTEAQKEIYQLVLDVQKVCINQIKPGIKIDDLKKTAIKMITEGLIKFDLLQGDLEENIKEKTFKKYFMHGLGHWLGIDVHDTGRIKREVMSLKAGHYITVEPGIYIPDEDDIEVKFRGIGIRIEDDVLVTDMGCEVLTSNIPKEIEDIENLVGSMNLP